jgi:hypothetical protein
MRAQRTTEEEVAVRAVGEFLCQGDYGEPAELEGWVDNPDVIFLTKIGRIACEIASVVPDTVIRWYFKKLPELPIGSSREIVIPREPHQWAMNIIRAKNKKIERYRARSKSRRIWLLIHSSDKASGILNPASPQDIELLRYSAHSVPHNFKKILFLDASGNAVELFDHKKRQKISVNYAFLKKGYPTYVHREVLLGAISGLSASSYSEVEVDFSKLHVGDRIILPPLDEKYSAVGPLISVAEENPKLTFGKVSDESEYIDPSLVFPELYNQSNPKRDE